MTSPSYFQKQPGEDYSIAIEFLDKLPTGRTLTSGTVAALDLGTGTSASATVLASTTATISGTQARVKVQAGTHGKDYKITFLCDLDNGETLEEDVIMKVREI